MDAFNQGLMDIFTIWIYAKYGFKSKTRRNWMNQVGLILFFIGGVMESGHDYLLQQFKKPENKGKLYMEGFAKYMVYPNYSGFILWRIGQSLLGNNIFYSLAISTIWYSSFIFGSIPEKENYMKCKYGQQYEEYLATTTKLIPGVY